MTSGSSAERVARTARHLQDSHGDPAGTFESAVEVTHAGLEGADAVSVSFVDRRGRVTTVAATDEMARCADLLQYELQEGPCLEAVRERHIVRSRDLAADDRWPTWGPRVACETSARSIVSYRLFTHADRLGALNVYSKTADAFTDVALEEGYAIAAHVSIAVAASQEVDALTNGLASRTVIGQATGILMERYDIDEVRAFGLLSRMSQDGNVKIRDLSAEVVRHRHQSGLPGPG